MRAFVSNLIITPVVLLALLLGGGCCGKRSTGASSPDLAWIDHVGARKSPKSGREFKVADYGGVADGMTLDSKAIQAAIDACAAAGGGKVTFAPGEYLTGSVFVKSGVNLHDNVMKASQGNSNQYLTRRLYRNYPDIFKRMEQGEFKSVRQAAIEAGIIKPSFQCPIDVKRATRLLKKHFTKRQAKRIAKRLLEDE